MEMEKVRLSEEIRKIETQAKLDDSVMRSRNASELDIEGDQDGAVLFSAGMPTGQKTRGPKISPFDERDDMDSYLHRFERYAELQEWKKEFWAVYLSALLKGTALDVYARLAPEQSKDYEILKTALLKRYALTEEGYKAKFYESKPEKGESPQQFIIRLENYFMRWLHLAKVKPSFEEVRALMVRERYLATCSKTLELFLRETAITDLQELGKLAEQFEDAHGTKAAVRQENSYSSPVKPLRRQGDSKIAGNAGVQSGQNRPRCFVCNKPGHIARNCFHRAKTGALMPTQNANVRQEANYRNPMRRQNQNFGTVREGNTVPQNKPVYCKAHHKPWCSDCFEMNVAERHSCGAMLDSEVRLSCGCTILLISEACTMGQSHSAKMPVTEGTLFGRTVRVLRDTGCSTILHTTQER